MKSASSSVGSVTQKVKDVGGIKVLAHRVDNLERAQMRTLIDQLRDKLGSGVVVLGSACDGKVALIVGVTKDLTSRIQAGKVIGPVAKAVGGIILFHQGSPRRHRGTEGNEFNPTQAKPGAHVAVLALMS